MARLACFPIALTFEGTIEGREATVMGRRIEGTNDMEATICAYGLLRDLGFIPAPEEVGAGYSMLEVMVAGGALIGVDFIPGVRPDIDVDGDGLEEIVVDDEGHIEACFDGDGTLIEGADCWQDDRIADGTSMTMRSYMVPAVYAGRDPRWSECDCSDPPEESVFDAR